MGRETYRENALSASELASAAKDEFSRKRYQRMAAAWLDQILPKSRTGWIDMCRRSKRIKAPLRWGRSFMALGIEVDEIRTSRPEYIKAARDNSSPIH